MRAVILSGVLFAATLAAPTVVRADDALDGKSYEVIVTRPNGRQEENTYSFKDGKLKSAACALSGYPPAPYTAKKNGNETAVTAVLRNERGDTRTVNATIVGDRMSGTVSIDEDGETSKNTLAPKPAGGS